MSRFATVGFMLALLQGGMSLQNSTPSSPGRVQFDPVETPVVRAGASVPVDFTFHIQPGFHVNSNQPGSPELRATELRLSPPTDLIIAKLRYPAGEWTAFPFDPENKLSVYSGTVTINALLMAQSAASPGSYTVHGDLTYQACDNRACYPPKKLPIEFNVKVGSKPRVVHRRTPQSPHIH